MWGSGPLQLGEFYTLLPPDGDIHYVSTVSETPSLVSIHLLANDTACVEHRLTRRQEP